METEADNYERSQVRLSTLQQEVGERDRANQKKAKELREREAELNQLAKSIQQRELVLERTQEKARRAAKLRTSLITPLLLICCIAAGYLVYEQLNKQRLYFNQMKHAEEHVDKIARVLNITNQRATDANIGLSLRGQELEAVQARLKLIETKLARLSSGNQTLLDFLQQGYGAKRDTDQPESGVLR